MVLKSLDKIDSKRRKNNNGKDRTHLWDHLEELRRVLFRVAISVIALMAAAFCFKETLFSIILAPKNSDFITYKIFTEISELLIYHLLVLMILILL